MDLDRLGAGADIRRGIKAVIESEIVWRYNSASYCFSGVQTWFKSYDGPSKRILGLAVSYLERKNSDANNRILALGKDDIEEIVSYIILQDLSEQGPSVR